MANLKYFFITFYPLSSTGFIPIEYATIKGDFIPHFRCPWVCFHIDSLLRCILRDSIRRKEKIKNKPQKRVKTAVHFIMGMSFANTASFPKRSADCIWWNAPNWTIHSLLKQPNYMILSSCNLLYLLQLSCFSKS